MRVDDVQKRDAINHLRGLLPVGTDVYVLTRHTSRSGMSRRMSVFVIDDKSSQAHYTDLSARDFCLRDITIMVGQATGFAISDSRGGSWELIVPGAGMDMHFHLVYTLGRVLFQRDESDRASDNGTAARNAGYALNKVSM